MSGLPSGSAKIAWWQKPESSFSTHEGHAPGLERSAGGVDVIDLKGDRCAVRMCFRLTEGAWVHDCERQRPSLKLRRGHVAPPLDALEVERLAVERDGAVVVAGGDADESTPVICSVVVIWLLGSCAGNGRHCRATNVGVHRAAGQGSSGAWSEDHPVVLASHAVT